MHLSRAVDGFLIARTADGYSHHTLESYARRLGQMVEYLGDPLLEAVTSEDVRRFFAWLREGYTPRRSNGDSSPLSPHTLSNAWCAIRSFCRWASAELGIERPDANLKQPRFQRPEISPLSQEDIKSVLDAVEYTRPARTQGRQSFRMKRPTGARDRALVLVLLDTGLRVSECARLRVEDVNLATGEVYVRPHGSGRKTTSRHVYLGRATTRAVWRYVAQRDASQRGRSHHPDDPLFLTIRGRPMNRNSIRLVLTRLGKRAGVPHVYPHRLRHTFAIQYLRNGGDVFSLQRLLGHSTLEMVRHYVALADADAANAHRRASPVDRWHL